MRIDGRKVKHVSAIATVSSKFQISIPKEVRDHLGLRPGEKVAFIAKPEGFLIIPAPKREDLAGMARGAFTASAHTRPVAAKTLTLSFSGAGATSARRSPMASS